MRDAVTLLVWLALVPLCFWSAHVGVLLWIWTALLAPSELLYGFMAGVPFNKLAAALTLGVLVLRREWQGFYLDTALAILLLLGVSATISAASPLNPGVLNDDFHERFLKVLALALVVTGVMSTRWRLHAAVVAICLAFSLDMLMAGARFLITAGGARITGRASYGDNNHLALAFLMSLPLVHYAMRQSSARIVRLAFAGLLAMGVLGVIGTYSRGGFVGLVILACWFVARSRRRLLNGSIVALAALTLYAATPASYLQRVESIQSAEQDDSFIHRVVAWKISALIAMDHPWFGGGFNSTQNVDTWLRYLPATADIDIVATPMSGAVGLAAHSIYFEVLGDLGFVGLLLFLMLLARCLMLASTVRRATRGDASKAWAGDLADALQASLVVFCVSGATLSAAYFEPLYLLVAIMSRLHHIVRARPVPVARPSALPSWRAMPARQAIPARPDWRANAVAMGQPPRRGGN